LAFAVTIRSVFARNAAAIACNAASLVARDAEANAYDASRARRHNWMISLIPSS
jgi:hypothetical protein